MPSNSRFPLEGRDWPDLRRELEDRRADRDMTWDSTRNLKASYNAGADVARIGWEAYALFSGDNMIYASTLYPSLQEIAGDVVAMGLEMMNGPEGSGGTVTTGGTESILLAVRTALNRARAAGTLPDRPRMVIPSSAHAAFTKAAELMGLEDVRVPIRDFRADVAAMEAAVDENTIMIAGSAHAYPFGCVDDISALGAIASERGLWLHVDGCLGGFVLPFAVDLGYDVPPFDLSVDGVSSISADLHKYGYTPRGASMLLLRDEEMAAHQMFRFSAWETGVFNTPTIAGSRPAGAIAGAWAVMNHLGLEGYRRLVGQVLDAKAGMIEALSAIEGIELCGRPEGGVIAWRSTGDLDMYAVRDGLTARGWQTAVTVDPPGFQLLLNPASAASVAPFAADVAEVAEKVRAGEIEATGTDMSYGV